MAALSHFPKFGPKRLKLIKKHFPHLEDAFKASIKDLMAAGIEEAVAREFASGRQDMDPEKIMDSLVAEGINLVWPEMAGYPALLKEIPDRPEVLYYRGRLPADMAAVAIVGTRKYTGYGQAVTEKISSLLAIHGLTIVSGLAIGIDTFAHRSCLEAGGTTIAVLGSGIDRAGIYPGQNRFLAEKIVGQGGALVSEFPPKTPPLKQNFPQRNRIVAGMTAGTVVVEADIKSGALITARLALDYNREVMAVPGNIFSQFSQGTNRLLKQGAKVITGAEDILETLDIETRQSAPVGKEPSRSPIETLILENISGEARHINELVRLTELDTSEINSTLAIMEMKGMVRNLGGMKYIKIT